MSKIFSKIFSKAFIKQFLKYIFVGALGTLVNLCVLYVFTDIFNVWYIISAVIAFLVSVINNYILNKIWTFQEKIQEQIIQKYFKYTFICILSLFVNISILFILVEFYDVWYIFAEVVAIGGAFLINFLGNNLWTFKYNSLELSSERKIELRSVL